MAFFEEPDEEEMSSDDDDDDDDDDEFLDLVGDQDLDSFRQSLSGMFGTLKDDDEDEDDDDDEEEDDDDDEEIPRTSPTSTPTSWADPVTSDLSIGMVLVANPARFCLDQPDFLPQIRGSNSTTFPLPPQPSLLSKYGLTLPPPPELGADRRADLLPVLVLVDEQAPTAPATNRGAGGIFGALVGGITGSSNNEGGYYRGILLNRRTGYLLGDLEQQGTGEPEDGKSSLPTPLLEKFVVQPLWFGGVDSFSYDMKSTSRRNSGSVSGLEMLHLCPTVEGAVQITPDGLYYGGDPAQAQEAMEIPRDTPDRGKSNARPSYYTGFDFKFFVQCTMWSPRTQLEEEIANGTWFPVRVAKEVLFQPRDRMGTRRAKPLWTEIMELLGGPYQDAKDALYRDDP
jgi:Uncharacterized ACR, COG1678